MVDESLPEGLLRNIVVDAGIVVFGTKDSPLRQLQGAELA